MHGRDWHSWAIALLLALPASALADEYLSRDDFLQLAFGGAPPELHSLWLTKDTRRAAETAVGWAPPALRLRYWQGEGRTAWILEEIGKEQPITIGVTICDDQIERVDVLAFRESRGWEIRYPFFTGQFNGISLAADGRLSKPVDGITGATLSVRAVERVARLALWLNRQVQG